jgi:hypothetical protein
VKNKKLNVRPDIPDIRTRELGHVGGRVVAETFVGLPLGDSSSYLSQDPLWTSDSNYQHSGNFDITELLHTALSSGSTSFI